MNRQPRAHLYTLALSKILENRNKRSQRNIHENISTSTNNNNKKHKRNTRHTIATKEKLVN